MKYSKHKIGKWLQFLRLPNLFTVPGDPLAGALIASFGMIRSPARVCAALAAGLFFYSAGLFLNDLCDLNYDRQHNPTRPLPAGQIQVIPVWIWTILLLILALGLCALLGRTAVFVGLALAACIIAYDIGLKYIPFLGPLLMGLCRGLSLLLGAAAMAGSFPLQVWIATALVTIYITFVTSIAKSETTAQPLGFQRWSPALTLAAGFAVLLSFFAPIPLLYSLAFIIVWLPAALISVHAALNLNSRAATRSLIIGRLISGLIPIQAALVLISGSVAWLGILLLLWPLNRWTAKFFYAS